MISTWSRAAKPGQQTLLSYQTIIVHQGDKLRVPGRFIQRISVNGRDALVVDYDGLRVVPIVGSKLVSGAEKR